MKQSEIDECQHQNMTADCVCQDCGYDRIIEPILERGRRQEQERIIKLLNTDCKDGLGDNLQGCFHEVAIALIKGEQK